MEWKIHEKWTKIQPKITLKWTKNRPKIVQNRASWRPKQGYSIGPVLGTILAASWEPLGGVLEASWRGLGAVLEASWPLWGAPWGRLGPSWNVVGGSWRRLGASWGAFKLFLRRFYLQKTFFFRHAILDAIFQLILARFCARNSMLKCRKIMKLYWKNSHFFLLACFNIRSFSDAIFVSTLHYFGAKKWPKSCLGGVLGRLVGV